MNVSPARAPNIRSREASIRVAFRPMLSAFDPCMGRVFIRFLRRCRRNFRTSEKCRSFKHRRGKALVTRTDVPFQNKVKEQWIVLSDLTEDSADLDWDEIVLQKAVD